MRIAKFTNDTIRNTDNRGTARDTHNKRHKIKGTPERAQTTEKYPGGHTHPTEIKSWKGKVTNKRVILWTQTTKERRRKVQTKKHRDECKRQKDTKEDANNTENKGTRRNTEEDTHTNNKETPRGEQTTQETKEGTKKREIARKAHTQTTGRERHNNRYEIYQTLINPLFARWRDGIRTPLCKLTLDRIAP